MLKQAASVVLDSSKSSTYPWGYDSGFDVPTALLAIPFEHPVQCQALAGWETLFRHQTLWFGARGQSGLFCSSNLSGLFCCLPPKKPHKLNQPKERDIQDRLNRPNKQDQRYRFHEDHNDVKTADWNMPVRSEPPRGLRLLSPLQAGNSRRRACTSRIPSGRNHLQCKLFGLSWKASRGHRPWTSVNA